MIRFIEAYLGKVKPFFILEQNLVKSTFLMARFSYVGTYNGILNSREKLAVKIFELPVPSPGAN